MKIWVVNVLKGWRITLPAEARRLLKLGPGDKIRWMTDSEGIVTVVRAPRPKKES